MTRKLPDDPDEKTTGRRDDWLKAHQGWRITRTWGLPGWWMATLNGHHVARYNDLTDLMDRLEDTYSTT